MKRLLFVFCPPSAVEELLRELEDWASKDVNGGHLLGKPLRFGETDRARKGLILFQWYASPPARLMIQLMRDERVFDFVWFEHTTQEEE